MSKQAVRGNKDFGQGLTRVGDPVVEEWFTDHSKVLQTKSWYGYEIWGPTYGNFWAKRTCTWSPHNWVPKSTPPLEPQFEVGGTRMFFTIYRCSRCGSQVYMMAQPPTRGRI